MLEVLETPDWLDDPRFATLSDRMAAIDELEREIEAITTTRTTADWIETLEAAGVPGGPVFTYDQALDDPHVITREMITEVRHPIMGQMRTIAPPTKFSDLPFRVRGPAPWLGQHTTEVLMETGYTDGEIKQLYADGVAFDQHPHLHPNSHKE